MIRIIDNFEGACVGSWRSMAESHQVYVEIHKEPITYSCGTMYDYNLHFWFGIVNQGSERITAEIFVEHEPVDSDVNKPVQIFRSDFVVGPYEPLTTECLSDRARKTKIELPLEPGEKVYVANTYPRNLMELLGSIDSAAAGSSAVEKVIGQSVEGREIRAYLYSEETFPTGRPVVMITSGFHPPEPDTFTTQATMEFLGTPDGKELLETCDVVVVPVVNPDGFFHGLQGCNITGTNIFWRFVTGDVEKHPESDALYRFALEVKPAIYVDYHCYTFQMENKESGPYLRPDCFYSGQQIRSLNAAISEDLISLNRGGHIRGTATYFPAILASMLNRRFNTITYAKYHLHLMDGVDRCRSLGVDTLKIIGERLKEAGIERNAEIIVKPHGTVPRSWEQHAQARWVTFKYFTLLPLLRKTRLVK